mmetsp:Transcript_9828/g.14772  ORF Transcript_9828/g.14772 Transcript_9828/m.14772 type:complete len:196 (-) Transcript_9828:163-750(-)
MHVVGLFGRKNPILFGILALTLILAPCFLSLGCIYALKSRIHLMRSLINYGRTEAFQLREKLIQSQRSVEQMRFAQEISESTLNKTRSILAGNKKIKKEVLLSLTELIEKKKDLNDVLKKKHESIIFDQNDLAEFSSWKKPIVLRQLQNPNVTAFVLEWMKVRKQLDTAVIKLKETREEHVRELDRYRRLLASSP